MHEHGGQRMGLGQVLGVFLEDPCLPCLLQSQVHSCLSSATRPAKSGSGGGITKIDLKLLDVEVESLQGMLNLMLTHVAPHCLVCHCMLCSHDSEVWFIGE